jgi:hypothetical protein
VSPRVPLATPLTEYKQIREAVKELQERQQMVDGKVSQLEGGCRKKKNDFWDRKKRMSRDISTL